MKKLNYLLVQGLVLMLLSSCSQSQVDPGTPFISGPTEEVPRNTALTYHLNANGADLTDCEAQWSSAHAEVLQTMNNGTVAVLRFPAPGPPSGLVTINAQVSLCQDSEVNGWYSETIELE
ncbi:MAG: hypothetical protein AAGA10_27020 [Bacteroidota bacterium]